jgi:hypothetical protein
LFSGRYKSLIVDGSGSGYLKSVGDYVRLNPARAKLVAAYAPLKSFAWSSWPAWLRVDRFLGEWGMPEDSPARRQRLEKGIGGMARHGGRRGVQADPARLMSGRGEVSGGVADTDERGDGGGDDDDGGVDRRASDDGPARLSEPSLVLPEETGRVFTNIKN